MDSSGKIVRDTVYKQFKAVMKDLLLKQSRWPAGAQIATERALADEFKLSRVTISKALSELQAEGLIEKRPPGGTSCSRATPPTSIPDATPPCTA